MRSISAEAVGVVVVIVGLGLLGAGLWLAFGWAVALMFAGVTLVSAGVLVALAPSRGAGR